MTTIALETGKAETQSPDVMQQARPNLHTGMPTKCSRTDAL